MRKHNDGNRSENSDDMDGNYNHESYSESKSLQIMSRKLNRSKYKSLKSESKFINEQKIQPPDFADDNFRNDITSM